MWSRLADWYCKQGMRGRQASVERTVKLVVDAVMRMREWRASPGLILRRRPIVGRHLRGRLRRTYPQSEGMREASAPCLNLAAVLPSQTASEIPAA
jgi:hypothetical protein